MAVAAIIVVFVSMALASGFWTVDCGSIDCGLWTIDCGGALHDSCICIAFASLFDCPFFHLESAAAFRFSDVSLRRFASFCALAFRSVFPRLTMAPVSISVSMSFFSSATERNGVESSKDASSTDTSQTPSPSIILSIRSRYVAVCEPVKRRRVSEPNQSEGNHR